MKKIMAIIAVLAISAFAFTGCKKQEAPKPAEQSAVTPTAPAAPAEAAAPAKH
jgi:PBP1b-binding outer membrane lipoprotein LpoB